jgi:hypothetical protein
MRDQHKREVSCCIPSILYLNQALSNPHFAATGPSTSDPSLTSTAGTAAAMPFELPPLPYAMDALEPHMSKQTLEFHYGAPWGREEEQQML